MVGARPQTVLRPAPSEADTETGSVSGLGRVRCGDLSSQFYEMFKRAHDELISSQQSQLMITQMKEGIWCQFTYFTTTVFVIFLVQFWWCQDWVPRLNICLLVVRSLFREIKTSHKATSGIECFNFAAEQLTKNTIGRKLECQQEILWSKFRNKRLMSWWCLCRISDFANSRYVYL